MSVRAPGAVSELRRAQAAERSLLEDLKRYREMFERASIGQLTMDLPGFRITAVNEVLCTLMGYTREELTGADGDLVFRHGGPWDTTPTERLVNGEIDSYVVERLYPRKDGHLVPVLDTVYAVRSEDGAVRQLLVLVQELSAQRAAEDARRDSRMVLEAAIASSQVSVTTFDRDLRFTFLAGGGITQASRQASDFLGRDVREVFDDPATLDALDAALAGHQSSRRTEYGGRTFSTVHAPLRASGERITGVISVSTDITAEVQGELAGSHNRALLDTVLAAVPMLVASYDLDGRLLEAAGLLYDERTEAKAMLGKHLGESPRQAAAASWVNRAAHGEEIRTTIEHEGRFYESYYAPTRDEAGTVVGVLSVVTDVTDSHRAEQRALFVASHDPLTGLLSRSALVTHLDAVLGELHQPCALIVADLDDLQVINDSLGHEVGDGVIRELAVRLAAALPDMTLARMGGDEFAVLIPGLVPRATVDEVIATVCSALPPVVRRGDHPITLTASLGIGFAAAGSPSSAVIRDADSALHEAKRSGRGEVRFYDPQSRRRIQRRLAIETGLSAALAAGDLRLAYQPVVTLADRRVIGAEALLRWNDVAGPVSHAELIPIAEASGLIVPLGEWVMNRACRDTTHLSREHDISIGVNVSVRQLVTGDFSAWLEDILSRSGLPATALIVEVTESAFLDDLTAVRVAFESVRRRGVRIAIDDFGTGFSSLARLQSVPVDIIKLDRAFVTDVADRPDARTMAVAILELSRAIGASIVAEGIETEAQAATLQEIGYERAQGFLFARPMSLAQLRRMLRLQGHTQAAGSAAVA